MNPPNRKVNSTRRVAKNFRENKNKSELVVNISEAFDNGKSAGSSEETVLRKSNE